MNYLKTGILLVVLTMLLVWIGGMIGGQQGMVTAFIFALLMNFGVYFFSDKIVLAMYRAQEIAEAKMPELYAIVRELTSEANIPMPKLYMVPQNAPNAFATGRNPKHAVVCVTSGIMDILSRDELKGVLAHELAHVKNRDTLIMTITASVAGAIMMIANMARWAAIFGTGGRDRNRGNSNLIGLLIVSILAPLAAMIIQLAISRTREYAADNRGARFAHSPYGLANALKKLDESTRYRSLNASPQTAHMFIVNPLRGEGVMNLFSTHPPIKERVRRLEGMSI
ncbi:MAG: protease HtpX [Candidatus Omnitrophica bacterium CG07_land_8_20_14_0_80_42_15]|uniref:Protease HtpX homolog n=1 Tax=Candidatus Aquitaenariimonas noxiae TaxID=1974741 RepID=A0A2J0L5A9_9BACT|nr:MAG: protease HtpX [Candidatus Omnitrophica bacterium CG07_land_8_20_14_0_80_42_15]